MTIFALATAPGRSGIAVFRISGPQAAAAVARMTGIASPAPRRAVRARFVHPLTRAAIDHGLLLWFPAPASFTGEDVAEFHIHGGRAVIAAMAGALASLVAVRPAEPGEFSRRAFEHGKMDLTEAEGLADLIDADTEAQRRQALRQMEGALGALYEDWRARIIRILALMEAYIDFPDEDIPEQTRQQIENEVSTLEHNIRAHLNDDHCGERIRDGIHIAIVGAPNAGKSSLLNWLARRDAAIVSSEAGTTRDVIEAHLDIDGLPVTIADTAGLRSDVGEVEKEGIRRALKKVEQADLVLAIFDGTLEPDEATVSLLDARSCVISNKKDLENFSISPKLKDKNPISVSLSKGLGLSVLMTRLSEEITARFTPSEAPAITRERHRKALESCVKHLSDFTAAPAPELQAESLRLAARDLGRVTGRIDVEDVLDQLFASFCIGK
ncbi:MAG: tRNA uridine-5-carboxymethylaminomethyl(34) synthesis GTPase MnmE [Alphaproteobacteria bacterium]|nr:tRNA uridine-5-carboxymethylaminomethyl(34) synthesis GTPase MnmE [Alphaproteobacteria bacterium]